MENRLPDGVFAASLTPLNKDLSVNLDKLRQHGSWLLDNGCDGLVLMGTTGEANSFDATERQEMLEALMKEGIQPEQIMVGTGCCSLTETVNLTSHALGLGVNHVLVLPPFYYRAVNDDGLFKYFEELIGRVDNPALKIYLYHFPRMSGLPFSHSLIEKLLQAFPGTIEGIKDSNGDWDNMSTMCDKFPAFRVFSGTEVFLTDLVQKGGSGTISASVNVASRQAGEVYRQIENTNGQYLQEQLTSLRKAIEKYPTIPILKLLMSQLHEDEDWLNIRPPLMPLPLWNEDEVKDIISQIRS